LMYWPHRTGANKGPCTEGRMKEHRLAHARAREQKGNHAAQTKIPREGEPEYRGEICRRSTLKHWGHRVWGPHDQKKKQKINKKEVNTFKQRGAGSREGGSATPWSHAEEPMAHPQNGEGKKIKTAREKKRTTEHGEES